MQSVLSLKNSFLIKLLIIIFSLFALIIFSNFFNTLNLSIEKIFSKVRGEINPDSNIVLIHISASDLEGIGPWPIKRSHYALLINNLTKNEVKTIGLEIFLSAKFISQTIYDNLLTKEIIKSKRVVLSSVAANITDSYENFSSDSLSYPSPKLIDENIITGHINYLQSPSFEIPLLIKANGISENAFSYQLIKSSIKTTFPKSLEINFISSWKRFKNFSLLEYYDIVLSQKKDFNMFKDKIVIIGVSDLDVAKGIETNYDSHAPAFTLHAFALDNLMNNRFLRDDFKATSTIISSLIYLLIAWLQKKYNNKRVKILSFAFFIMLTLVFIMFNYLHLRLDYSAILVPLILFLTYEIITVLTERESVLEEIMDETKVLKTLLENREKELERIKNELEISDRNKSAELQNKIKVLETEISKLSDKKEDQVEAVNTSVSEVKNFWGIVYKSKVLQKVVDVVEKTAAEDATILITGESGTGKELVARAIHNLSRRNQFNFVAVNCGAISESLLESELFGHIKGSFTGATTDKVGRFEAANNGTIFLDEVAETSENFQIKLLRVLQFGEFEKVGSSKTSRVNVRIIAATNKKLESLVKEKKFREDLFYRLNVIRIELPPLSERKEDIEPIARYFLERETSNFKLSKAAVESLLNHTWPGNVRELESVIKRAAIFARSSGRAMIQLNDLPSEIVKRFKLNFEDLVLDSLRQKKFSHSSIVETAKELGNVNRTSASENFRGIVFKVLVESEFNREKTAEIIACTKDEEVLERVKSKIHTFVSNIAESLENFPHRDFELVKSKLTSKYKNLPQRFHPYLDEIIKHYLSKGS